MRSTPIPVIASSNELSHSGTETFLNNENIVSLLRKRSILFDNAFTWFFRGSLIDSKLSKRRKNRKNQIHSKVDFVFVPWEFRECFDAKLELSLMNEVLLYDTLDSCITINYCEEILDLVIFAISSGSSVAWDIKITMRFYLNNNKCSVFYFSPKNHLTAKAWIDISEIKKFTLLFD